MADYSFVTNRLATGAAISSKQDVEDVVAAGISCIIDCRDDFDDASLLGAHPDLALLWNGVPDDGLPKPVSWFRKSIEFGLSQLSKPNSKLLCHCAAGVNRGPSTAFAILIAFGIRPSDAEAMIRAARPQVGLAYKNDAVFAIKALGYV